MLRPAHAPCPSPPPGVSRPLHECVREFGRTWRWSVGVGVVLPTWVGRFEANYVAVLSAQVRGGGC